jgi:hypothetical protein
MSLVTVGSAVVMTATSRADMKESRHNAAKVPQNFQPCVVKAEATEVATFSGDDGVCTVFDVVGAIREASMAVR